MSTALTILAWVQIIMAVVIVFVVVMQQGNSRGLGAISGGADTFFGKNKGKTMEALFSKWTTALAILFVVCTIALNIIVAMK